MTDSVQAGEVTWQKWPNQEAGFQPNGEPYEWIVGKPWGPGNETVRCVTSEHADLIIRDHERAAELESIKAESATLVETIKRLRQLERGEEVVIATISEGVIKEADRRWHKAEAELAKANERAAWAVEAKDALLAVIKDYQFSAGKRELGQVYAASHPVINAAAVFARYPQQQEGN